MPQVMVMQMSMTMMQMMQDLTQADHSRRSRRHQSPSPHLPAHYRSTSPWSAFAWPGKLLLHTGGLVAVVLPDRHKQPDFTLSINCRRS
jgi:hypothetical protein